MLLLLLTSARLHAAPVAEVSGQSVWCQRIDLNVQQRIEFLPDSTDFEQLGEWRPLNQQSEVSALLVIIMDGRTENPNARHMVALRDVTNLREVQIRGLGWTYGSTLWGGNR